MMKIALFYPRNLYAGWYAQGGYRLELERMGHEVLDAWVPGNEPSNDEHIKRPTINELNECDLILSMYHEYMVPWYMMLYGFENWQKLKVPVIARFDESFDRPDLLLHRRWDEMKRWAQYFSFPAEQDADKYGGQWEPFGADLSMFNPLPTGDEDGKKYEIGFIGSPYAVRTNYITQLAAALPNTLTFHWAPCMVQDLGGINTRKSTELLAQNYRQLKIFFCLPPISKLIVAKIADVLACGTFVMYPLLPYHARKNMNQFENKKHLVYYDPGYVNQNAKQILHYLESEVEREKIADTGRCRVQEKYTLTLMLTRILSLVESKVLVLEKSA